MTRASSLEGLRLPRLCPAWKLKTLEGKALPINLWATWCGPCRSELPKFEKVCEQLKERADVQVMSFNVDKELGLVEPFVKEQGYTFPVLPAYGFVRDMFEGYGIPHNWLVHPSGKSPAAKNE